VTLTIPKDTLSLNAPTGFTANDIKSNGVRYTWIDNSHGEDNEEKFILKDGYNNTILVDNISANTTEYVETNLKYQTNYRRIVCAVRGSREKCSPVILFSTPIPEPKVYTYKTSVR
jgi:hypothetical protein